MKRNFVFIMLVMFLVACSSHQQGADTLQQPPQIATGTHTPIATKTLLASTETLDWLEFIREAYRPLEFTEDEILEYTDLIKQALINHSPEDIASLMHYPIHLCGLCGGAAIENEEEFIEAYDDLIDDYRVSNVLNQPYNDLIIKAFYTRVGLGRGDIWLQKLCYTSDCELVSGPRITLFMSYCHSFREIYGDDKTEFIWLEDGIFMDGSTFEYGTYVVTTIEDVGGTALTNEEIESYKSITILPDMIDFSSSGGFKGPLCEKPELEFCGPTLEKGQPIGYEFIGRLNIICDDMVSAIFDVISGGKLGDYYDGKYFILERVEEGE